MEVYSHFDLCNKAINIQKTRSLDETARELSSLWGYEVTGEDVYRIVEQHMLPQGLAYPAGQAPPPSGMHVEKKPLFKRLLAGTFHWQFMKGALVKKICSPLVILYTPFLVSLAVVLIFASRWMLYSALDRRFAWQLATQFESNDYLVSLALLIGVVLIHEFGHAAAQLRCGLTPGPIGFQLYHYIPTFFANVNASWGLKPARRAVVDIGGIYFQAIAASALHLIYLKTHFDPLLTVILASDVLCIAALIPFLKFDGYWLLSDVLAVPNLEKLSGKLVRHYWNRLLRRGGTKQAALPMGYARGIAIAAYAILRDCFWLLVALVFISRAKAYSSSASIIFSNFFSQCLDGLKSRDAALVASSLIRATLFALVLLTIGTFLWNVFLKLFRLVRAAAEKMFSRRVQKEAACKGGR